ncbi:MAG TPA: hypothetical protein VIV35_01190 [Chitinophagaceae bacterium]
MKKIFVSLSLLLTVASSTAFANKKDTRRYPGVEEVFKQEFAGAENVSWSQQENYQKATFVLAGHRVIAYFNEDNELAGCIRDIFYDQLPLTVMKAIDKKFPGADLQEVREITNSDGTSYLLRADLNNKKFKVRISSAGNITDIEKLAK